LLQRDHHLINCVAGLETPPETGGNAAPNG